MKGRETAGLPRIASSGLLRDASSREAWCVIYRRAPGVATSSRPAWQAPDSKFVNDGKRLSMRRRERRMRGGAQDRASSRIVAHGCATALQKPRPLPASTSRACRAARVSDTAGAEGGSFTDVFQPLACTSRISRAASAATH